MRYSSKLTRKRSSEPPIVGWSEAQVTIWICDWCLKLGRGQSYRSETLTLDIYGETMETVSEFIFLAPKSQLVTAAMKLKDVYSLEGKL